MDEQNRPDPVHAAVDADAGLGAAQHPARHRRGHRSWMSALVVAWPRRLATTRQRVMAVAAVLCVAAGAALALVLSSSDPVRPPTPPRPAAETPVPTVTSSPSRTAESAPFRCGRATRTGGVAPVRICIPSIRVDADVMRLGLNENRTVQVPPLSKVGTAGWYRYSAQPGAVGPTVILGHVDSAQYGDGVFFRLSKLEPGDSVELVRGDGRVATYRITRVREVSKNRFPSQDVYGSTSGPAIRLVTCGGQFDSATGSYLDNIIAYGTLDSLGPKA